MSNRIRGFFLAMIFMSAVTSAYAQVSVDEAMERLRERQAAEREAVSTQPDSPPQNQQTPALPKFVADLSTQVQNLDTLLNTCFSGTIQPTWAPAETQEWLNTGASKSSAAALKLMGVETSAKIIIDSVASDASSVTVQGHLYPVVMRAAISRTGKMMLRPSQVALNAAEKRVENLDSQLDDLLSQRSRAAMDLNLAIPGEDDRISRDRAIIADADSQTSDLQQQLADAQKQSQNAHAAMARSQRSVLQNENTQVQAWGPITVDSQDRSLLKKLPGNIISLRVRVTGVDVTVARSPDGAGWEFSDAAGNEGQTHMPMAADPTGPGAIASEVQRTITITSEDIASYPTPSAGVRHPMVASSTPNPGSGVAAAQPLALVRGYVSTPHEDNAMSAAVGFVVVGIQAVLPDGETRQRPLFSGSCFAVTPTGYLLTNRHVVESLDELKDPELHEDVRAKWNLDFQSYVWVFFAGEQSVAQVAYVSSKFDLAVLKIPRAVRVCFRLAASPAEQRGADVYAAGFPGLGSIALSASEVQKEMQADDALSDHFDIKSRFKSRDFEFTLTKGTVGRIFSDADGERWVQHEAVIRHGNSGGPLINESGLVVGINTASQQSDGDVQTNLSQEISQFRQELDFHVPGIVWAAR
jgi:S1-C subfamily serine protease